MATSDPKLRLPTDAELPCSDDTPVDNENQNFIANLLLFLLKFIWGNRSDWFFGVDMRIYHTTGVSPQDRHQPVEIDHLVSGEYQPQIGEPYWMSEIN